ncbi:MAG: co-chaperone GroES [Candidatus Yonathbacteria bacterium]|nr:co-chaperone GroES [Candidatus Yonathbacteria bacterium]
MNTKHKIIPLGDKVLIRPMSGEEGKKTKSGIIIPETIDKEKPEQGKVIAVGQGRTNDEGKVLPMKVKVGDTVLFSKYGPDEVKIDGEEYFILSEGSILAVIK